jgi:hypothetical protein
MATETPQSANAPARATFERVEQAYRAAASSVERVGGDAAHRLARALRARRQLALAVVVGVLVVALLIWYLAAHAPAILLFAAQVIIAVVITLAALSALLWLMLRALLGALAQPADHAAAPDMTLGDMTSAGSDEAPDRLELRLGALLRAAARRAPQRGARPPASPADLSHPGAPASLSMLEKRRLAYSEAGHVVAQSALAPDAPVERVALRPMPLRPAVGALGLAVAAPRSAEDVFAAIQIALASRAAQEVFLHARLVSAADDLAAATTLALRSVACWGMGDSLIATPLAASQARLLADSAIREQVERLLRRAFDATSALLEQRRDEVIALAEALAERETLEGAEVADLLRAAAATSPAQRSALTSVAEATLFGTTVAPDFQMPAPYVIGPVAPTATAASAPSAPQPTGGAGPRVSRASGPSAFAASPSQELRADRVVDRALLRAPLRSRGTRRTDPDLPAVSKSASNGASNGANGSGGGV